MRNIGRIGVLVCRLVIFGFYVMKQSKNSINNKLMHSAFNISDVHFSCQEMWLYYGDMENKVKRYGW